MKEQFAKVSIMENSTQVSDFLSPEEKDNLTEADLAFIDKIQSGTFYGGILLSGFSWIHHDRDPSVVGGGSQYGALKESTSFAPWSSIVELGYNDTMIFIHNALGEMHFTVDNPVVAKGIYLYFGHLYKRFLQYPKAEVVSEQLMKIGQFKTTAGE